MRGTGTVDDISREITTAVKRSGFTAELIDSIVKTSGGFKVRILIFEKYFMRSSNRAGLTVVISGENGNVEVNAVGSGGSQNALFRFSWGTEQSFENTVFRHLRSLGFK